MRDVEHIDRAAERMLFFARKPSICPDMDIFINSATARKARHCLPSLSTGRSRQRAPRRSPLTTIPIKKKTFRLA
jgi:hypothetical protein